ncbi:hypothetical protein [Hymenobacter sp. BT491]|uniref:hypothetical protein n=1 Tax=Hymenobacter sp. BT491 TaxID=2766779 RepID=UPI001653C2DA|nr:hypothetical protein [Hymenobacter sp. BT491]MBC6992286.1 hypothetical protein [Hymenobacter sp. BT491]
MNTIELVLLLAGVGYLFIEKFFRTNKGEESQFNKSTLIGKILSILSVSVAIVSVIVSYSKGVAEDINRNNERIANKLKSQRDSIKAINDSIMIVVVQNKSDSIKHEQELAKKYMLKQYSLDTVSFNKMTKSFEKSFSNNLKLMHKIEDNYNEMVAFKQGLINPLDTSNMSISFVIKLTVNNINQFDALIDSCKKANVNVYLNENILEQHEDLSNIFNKMSIDIKDGFSLLYVNFEKKGKELGGFKCDFADRIDSACYLSNVWIEKSGNLYIRIVNPLKQDIKLHNLSYYDLNQSVCFFWFQGNVKSRLDDYIKINQFNIKPVFEKFEINNNKNKAQSFMTYKYWYQNPREIYTTLKYVNYFDN